MVVEQSIVASHIERFPALALPIDQVEMKRFVNSSVIRSGYLERVEACLLRRAQYEIVRGI